jgi:hypothetical protein
MPLPTYIHALVPWPKYITRCASSIGNWCSTQTWQRCISTLGFILAGFCFVSPLPAEGTWEYSPYRVQVWVLLEPSPYVSEQLTADLRDSIPYGSLAAMQYGWQTSVDWAPAALTSQVSHGLAGITYESLLASAGKLPDCDKLFLLHIGYRAGAYSVAAQEWDIPTRLPTAPLEYSTFQTDAVPPLAMQAIYRSFRPLVKIERVEGREIKARIRAGGLVTTETSPLLIEKGMILHPVIRRNQRNGEPIPNGIQNPAWTYLEPESREGTMVTCKLQTAYAAVIPTKGGQRLDRLALLVQRRFDQTEVLVQTKKEAPTRDKAANKRLQLPSRPLPDYEVYSKEPAGTETKWIGLTDWRGTLRLKVDERPLYLLYVRNGGQFLARLPVVVGERSAVAIEVGDDDPRLLAETKIRALQSRLMDAEARRELLASRIRANLDNRKFDDAEKLLVDLKQLPQRSQLTRELEEMRRNTAPAQGTTKTRIDKLFNDANRVLVKFLNPELPTLLQKEIDAARTSLRPAPPAKPAPNPLPETPAQPTNPTPPMQSASVVPPPMPTTVN